MLSKEEKKALIGNGLVIYHALEERDWKRMEDPEFKKILDEVQRISERCEELLHPPIDPKWSAEELKKNISKKNREEALLNLTEVLLGCLSKT